MSVMLGGMDIDDFPAIDDYRAPLARGEEFGSDFSLCDKITQPANVVRASPPVQCSPYENTETEDSDCATESVDEQIVEMTNRRIGHEDYPELSASRFECSADSREIAEMDTECDGGEERKRKAHQESDNSKKQRT